MDVSRGTCEAGGGGARAGRVSARGSVPRIAASAVLVFCLLACGNADQTGANSGSGSSGPSTPPSPQAIVNVSRSRLSAAVLRRETAATDPDALRDALRRLPAAEATEPVRAVAAGPAADAEVRRRLARLVPVREEALLNGSLGYFDAAAEARWEVNELARVTGVEEELEDLALLTDEQITTLQERWHAKRRVLDEARAFGVVDVDAAIAAADERLARLDALGDTSARAQRVDRFFHRARDALSDESRAAAHREALGRRDAEVRAQTVRLLEQDLARHSTSVRLRMRLWELDPNRETGSYLSTLALSEVDSAMPGRAPADENIGGLSRAVVMDPVGAARSRARLRLQWEAEGSNGDFEAWRIQQLSDEDRAAARAWLTAARQYADEVDALDRGTADVGPTRERIAAELALIEQESHRDRSAIPPSHPLDHLAGPRGPPLVDDPRGRQALHQALEEYRTRGPQTDWAVTALEQRLRARAFADVADEVVADAARLRTIRDRITRAGAPHFDAPGRDALRTAIDSMRARRDAVLAGLAPQRYDDPDAARLAHEADRRLRELWVLGDVVGDGRPPTPFGDARLAAQRQEFRRAATALEAMMVSPHDTFVSGPPVLAEMSGTRARVSRLATQERVRSRGFETRVTYEDVSALRGELPGGVAFGVAARLPSSHANGWLVYRADSHRLFVAGPRGQTPIDIRVDPDRLRTSLAFVESGDPVAISIETMESLAFEGAQHVVLHPSLQDTAVGWTMFDLDKLPWSLDEARLPNGARNPLRSRMEPLLDQFEHVRTDPYERAITRIRQAAARLPDGGDCRLALRTLRPSTVSEEPRVLEYSWAALSQAAADCRTELGEHAVEMVALRLELQVGGDISLITDTSVALGERDGALVPTTRLRVRYVTRDRRLTDQGFRVDMTQRVADSASSDLATRELPGLGALYPAVGDALRDVALMALIRWARSGTAQRLDLAELALEPHRASRPTPDFVCQGPRLAACRSSLAQQLRGGSTL